MAHRRGVWLDLGLTAVLVVISVMGTGPAAANQHQPAPALSYVLAVAASVPIVLWRYRPMWTFGLTGAVTMLYLGLGYAYGPIMIALAVAIYGFAVRTPVRPAVIGIAALLAAGGLAVGAGTLAGAREWPEFVSVAAWLVIPAAVGLVVNVRRDASTHVRAEQTRRAISEERLQLAQEVHDVVGHGLAVIAMQAGVALRVLDRDPSRVRAALEAIRGTSKEALDDLRAEVEALRRGPGQPATPLRPAAGLGDLPALVERIRSSGLPVDAEIHAARGLPADADRAAYRIVQEALTNVLRHAGPQATARVRIDRDAGALRIEVVDTGVGGVVPAADRGSGLAGMRERAAALGGTVDAGPRPGGGFAVRARLPVAAGAPAPGGSA